MFFHDTKKSRFFSEKWSLQAIYPIWAALPGAQHLEMCFTPKDIFHMTRRAFLALRVIQRQGKSRWRRLVKKWCKWIRKMKISQNLWIQLTPEQFSRLDQVTSYPGMQLVCLSMRFREIPTGGCVRSCLGKSRFSWNSEVSRNEQDFRKIVRCCDISDFFGPAGGSRTLTGAFAPRAREKKEKEKEREVEKSSWQR